MESVVADIVADVFPEATIESVDPTRTGNFKQTVVVELENHNTVVVQFRRLDHGALEPEAKVTEVIGERTEVPVPPIVGVGTVGSIAYLLTERVPGVNLHDRYESLPREDRIALTRTMGRFLAALHATFSFDTYGSVVPNNGSLHTPGETSTWQGWLQDYLEAGLSALPDSLQEMRPAIKSVAESQLSELPTAPTPRLYPWDFRPGNILLAEDDPSGIQIAAVLDWGDPLAAHRELSMAKAEYLIADWYADDQLADRLRSAFYSGYTNRLSISEDYWTSRRRLYRTVAIVRSAVDSQGEVTRPRSPMVDTETAERYHRRHLRDTIAGDAPQIDAAEFS